MPGGMTGSGLVAHWITETLPDVNVSTSVKVLAAVAREWTLLAKPYDMAEVERRLREMTAQG